MKVKIILPAVGLAALAVAGVVFWGAGNTPVAAAVEVGEPMPGFTLNDIYGKERKLSDFSGKIVVIEFCSQECPFSRGSDPHLSALAKQYAGQGVVVLGIDSHHGTTPEAIKKYAEEKGKTYPILKDTGNGYADAAGAKVTPEVFVVDQKGNVAYHGAFDNRKSPDEKGDIPYVENAVKALLDGKPVDPKTVKAWGCSIKRAPK